MKFVVAKQDLEAALAVVAPVVSGTGDDLTTHLLFRIPKTKDPNPEGLETGKMEVLSHSGRVIAMCPFVASWTIEDVGQATMFTVEAGGLRRWLDWAPDAAFVVQYDDATKLVTVTAEGFGKKHGAFHGCSLDPSNWHFWDKSLDDSVPTMKIPANRLHAALDHSRMFASTQETQTPEHCVCEVKNGVLASTDKASAALITVPGVEKSTLKLHVRDVAHILSFLSSMKEQEIEVLEHARTTFFRRPDGAVYGESRFTASFPGFRRPSDKDDHKWTLDVANLRRQLMTLAASTEKGDRRARFIKKDGMTVDLGMAVKGVKMTNLVEIDLIDEQVAPNAVPLPADGFQIPHPHLINILDRAKGDKITFGINVKMKDGELAGGYIRFVDTAFASETDAGDEYITVLAFMRHDA